MAHRKHYSSAVCYYYDVYLGKSDVLSRPNIQSKKKKNQQKNNIFDPNIKNKTNSHKTSNCLKAPES